MSWVKCLAFFPSWTKLGGMGMVVTLNTFDTFAFKCIFKEMISKFFLLISYLHGMIGGPNITMKILYCYREIDIFKGTNKNVQWKPIFKTAVELLLEEKILSVLEKWYIYRQPQRAKVFPSHRSFPIYSTRVILIRISNCQMYLSNCEIYLSKLWNVFV